MPMLEWLTAIRGRFIAGLYVRRLPAASRVLDVGCGSGVVAEILRRQLRLEVTCADTARLLKRELPFTAIEDGRELPFADLAFDAAMLNDVLHHVVDQKGLIERTLRVAKRVLIFEVEPSLPLRLIEPLLNLFHYGGLPAPGVYRTAQGWRRFLTENGHRFEIEEAGRPAFWYPFKHLVMVIEHA